MTKRRGLIPRKAPRAQVAARAFARQVDGWIGPLAVANLSAGGALLVGPTELEIGQTFELELRLRGASIIRVAARVLRCAQDAQGPAIAVQFQDPPADVEDAIQDAVARALARSRKEAAAAIVVVTPRPHDVDGVAAAITGLGAAALVARTFLDALRWLQDPCTAVKALVVDVDTEGGIGPAAMAWCAEEFPHVRRVLLVPQGYRSAGASAWGDSCVLLSKPVSRHGLERAFGRSSTRRRIRAQAASSPA